MGWSFLLLGRSFLLFGVVLFTPGVVLFTLWGGLQLPQRHRPTFWGALRMQKDVSSPLPCLLLCEAGGELRRPSTAEQFNDPPCIPLSNLNSMRNALPTQLLALAKITTLAANLVVNLRARQRHRLVAPSVLPPLHNKHKLRGVPRSSATSPPASHGMPQTAVNMLVFSHLTLRGTP